ncbi:MAG: serine hydrolase [Bacteroidota bacterium]
MKRLLLALPILILAAGIWYYPNLKRVNRAMSFFEPELIVENFRTTATDFPYNELTAAKQPSTFPKKTDVGALPETFTYGRDATIETAIFLEDTYTTGLLVLQDDTIRHEAYFRGHTPQTPQIVWSVSKSFLSALLGIAVAEGHIKRIEQTVEEYCPELTGTAYEGVTIKDVLQMSTGVGFNEDYADFWSDINRWGRDFAWGNSQDAFAASLVREREPGTFHHYVSINTHVLGMILVKATGRGVADYAQEKLWEPLGMEHDSYWLKDGYGMEVALGGLNTTVRNCAKMGSVFANGGQFRGRQIVPEDWVKASVTPDADHLRPGPRTNSAHDLGYGYQWWIPQSEQGEFLAVGVYNQFIYVNPTTNTVIVKHSANPNFTTADTRATTPAFLSFCRAVVEEVAPKPLVELAEVE